MAHTHEWKELKLEKKRASVRAALKKRRAMLRSSGRCVNCGLPKTPADLGTLCTPCKEKRRIPEELKQRKGKKHDAV